jgi:hypothetical protein
MMEISQDRLIEAGFEAFINAQMPLDPDLAIDLRIAFYAGAQHMFSSMVQMARSQCKERISVATIERELQTFVNECALRGAPCAGNA